MYESTVEDTLTSNNDTQISNNDTDTSKNNTITLNCDTSSISDNDFTSSSDSDNDSSPIELRYRPIFSTDAEYNTNDHILFGNNNIKVDAVAGSGKTTFILRAAKQMKNTRMIMFTYNRELSEEVNQKRIKVKIPDTSLIVKTFHACAVQYYGRGKDDKELTEIYINNIQPINNIPAFDVVAIDEVQDMTSKLFSFIVKFYADMLRTNQQYYDTVLTHRPRIFILGDAYQSVYRFKDAKFTYLTETDAWSKFNGMPFDNITLDISYRVDVHAAKFINDVMFPSDKSLHYNGRSIPVIRTPDNRNKMREYDPFKVRLLFFDARPIRMPPKEPSDTIPQYRVLRSYEEILAKRINKLLINPNTRPDDIFVLAPSVKRRMTGDSLIEFEDKHLQKLASLLNEKYHVIETPNDDAPVNAESMRNKITFATYCSVKGRERDHVFIINFDSSHYIYNKDCDKSVCPETLYVAITRAKKSVTLLCEVRTEPLQFLTMGYKEMFKQDYIDVDTDMPGELGDKIERPISLSTNIIIGNNAKILIDFIRESPSGGHFMPYSELLKNHLTDSIDKALRSRRTACTNFTKFIKERYMEHITSLVDSLYTSVTLPDIGTIQKAPISPKPCIYQTVKNNKTLTFFCDDLVGMATPNYAEIMLIQYNYNSPAYRPELCTRLFSHLVSDCTLTKLITYLIRRDGEIADRLLHLKISFTSLFQPMCAAANEDMLCRKPPSYWLYMLYHTIYSQYITYVLFADYSLLVDEFLDPKQRLISSLERDIICKYRSLLRDVMSHYRPFCGQFHTNIIEWEASAIAFFNEYKEMCRNVKYVEHMSNHRRAGLYYARQMLRSMTHILCESDTYSKSMRMACIYEASLSGYISRLLSIRSYDFTIHNHHRWSNITPSTILHSSDFLCRTVLTTDTYNFEHDMHNVSFKIIDDETVEVSLNIMGTIDYKDDKYAYEFKHTNSLGVDHKLQLCVYALMLSAHQPDKQRIYRLLNTKTGECYEFTMTDENKEILYEIYHVLCANMESKEDIYTDDKFVDKCHEQFDTIWAQVYASPIDK
jgi:nucleoside-triphosphatase THEP1